MTALSALIDALQREIMEDSNRDLKRCREGKTRLGAPYQGLTVRLAEGQKPVVVSRRSINRCPVRLNEGTTCPKRSIYSPALCLVPRLNFRRGAKIGVYLLASPSQKKSLTILYLVV